jgi:hypothetical protein
MVKRFNQRCSSRNGDNFLLNQGGNDKQLSVELKEFCVHHLCKYEVVLVFLSCSNFLLRSAIFPIIKCVFFWVI